MILTMPLAMAGHVNNRIQNSALLKSMAAIETHGKSNSPYLIIQSTIRDNKVAGFLILTRDKK
jgi:hypothetical protein